ncbi:MAG: hypothetical protein LUQ25_07620 [Methanoregulaceae archaeon]|nr:hypothetical protein [Methanoregulaceae archaeon]
MRKTFVLATFALLFVAGAMAAEMPSLPESFYGKVMLNGVPAPVGTVVTATVDGVEYARITTTTAGYYSWDGKGEGPGMMVDKLSPSVPASGSSTINFLVNGVEAAETAMFSPGDLQRVDLSATGTGTIPPTVTHTQVATYTEISSLSSTNTNTSGFQTGNNALQASDTPPAGALPATTAGPEGANGTGMQARGDGVIPGNQGSSQPGITQAPSEGQPSQTGTRSAGPVPIIGATIAAGSLGIALCLRKSRG